MIYVNIARRGINRFGARKYAKVPSESRRGLDYIVVKYRKKGTRNYGYMCTCENFVYRQLPCKHIRDFKRSEFYNFGYNNKGGDK